LSPKLDTFKGKNGQKSLGGKEARKRNLYMTGRGNCEWGRIIDLSRVYKGRRGRGKNKGGNLGRRRGRTLTTQRSPGEKPEVKLQTKKGNRWGHRVWRRSQEGKKNEVQPEDRGGGPSFCRKKELFGVALIRERKGSQLRRKGTRKKGGMPNALAKKQREHEKGNDRIELRSLDYEGG